MKASTVKIEIVSILLEVALLCVIFTSCNENRKNATLSGSQDTTSVTRAGGPPITDTATLNAQRKSDSTTAPKDTAAKGNADPTGHMNKPKTTNK